MRNRGSTEQPNSFGNPRSTALPLQEATPLGAWLLLLAVNRGARSASRLSRTLDYRPCYCRYGGCFLSSGGRSRYIVRSEALQG